MDFPDPVSEARRYCRHSGVSKNRCFRDKAWMGVGDADCPRIWCTESRSPSSKGGDENVTGTGSEPREFGTERSNSSANGLTALTVAAGVVTSFKRPDVRFEDHDGSRFVGGVSGVLPRISPFRSILISRRDCLLANLSALGPRMGEDVDVLGFADRPTWGSEPRENSGATSSRPPFLDRGVRSLTRRVRDGSGRRVSMNVSLHNCVAATYLCVRSGIKVDEWREPYGMAKTSG